MLPVLKYNGVVIAKNIEFARTMLTQSLGLMFRKSMPHGFSMIFIFKKPSRVNIHMLFVFFQIDVIFLNEEKKVITKFNILLKKVYRLSKFEKLPKLDKKLKTFVVPEAWIKLIPRKR